MMKTLPAAVVAFLLTSGLAMQAQEGSLPTQLLVNVDAKSRPPSASDLTVQVNNHKEPLSAWTPVLPARAQVAVLIDDGLRESVGRELGNLKKFVLGLPPGVEVLVGYMQNGRVVQNQPFTSDHALAASNLRLPQGMPGESASPYFCLSDFVKHWPDPGAVAIDPNVPPTIGRDLPAANTQKARFVLMITNGVDLYNGSTSLMNQDSPYVETAVTDAQRADVAVYSIYYGDAGIRGGSASFSGQSYLQQVADGTGGIGYFDGNGNPVSMAPFLTKFQQALGATYVATFEAPGGKEARDLVRVKVSSSSKAKLRSAQMVRPGNVE